MDDGTRKQRLCRQYYTDGEWEAYQDEERRRNEEKKQKEKQETLCKCREDIEQALSAARDHYEVCDILSERLLKLRWRADEFFVCLSIFKDNIESCAEIGKTAACRVAESIIDECRYNRIEWGEVQGIISKMEVVDDGNSND